MIHQMMIKVSFVLELQLVKPCTSNNSRSESKPIPSCHFKDESKSNATSFAAPSVPADKLVASNEVKASAEASLVAEDSAVQNKDSLSVHYFIISSQLVLFLIDASCACGGSSITPPFMWYHQKGPISSQKIVSVFVIRFQ